MISKKQCITALLIISSGCSTATTTESNLTYELERIDKGQNPTIQSEVGLSFDPKNNLLILTNKLKEGIEVRTDTFSAIFSGRSFSALTYTSRPNVQITASQGSAMALNQSYSRALSQPISGSTMSWMHYLTSSDILTTSNTIGSAQTFSSQRTITFQNPEKVYVPAGATVFLSGEDLLKMLFDFSTLGTNDRLRVLRDRCSALPIGANDEECANEAYEETKRVLAEFFNFFGGELTFEVLYRRINQATWLVSRQNYSVKDPKHEYMSFEGGVLKKHLFYKAPDRSLLVLDDFQEQVLLEVTGNPTSQPPTANSLRKKN